MADRTDVVFHDSPAHGRVACLVSGPDVAEVIDVSTGLESLGDDRVAETARWFGVDPSGVRAAVAYYTQHREEIDAQIQQRRSEAEVLRRRCEAEQALG